MEIKHYTNIKVLDENIYSRFKPGDQIVIQEKIDGANFSIRYDSETDTVRGFSRRYELSPEMGMKRALKFVQSVDKELYRSVLGDNLIVFLEWLEPHIVNYPKERYRKPYCFDVYDIDQKKYIKQVDSMKIAEQLGVEYVPTFYTGPFISWDHVKSFVGKTSLGGESGEGVVVKNQTNTVGFYSKSNNYTKIVGKAFAEKQYVKLVDEEKLAAQEKAEALTRSIVTEARVKKLLCKMVDEGYLREDWDSSDITSIHKQLPREIYHDCVKEEPEIVKEAGKLFGGYANRISKEILETILQHKE